MSYNYSNARLSGADTTQGNVAHYMNKMAEMIAVNDGAHRFHMGTLECHDNPAPVLENQDTVIALTYQGYHITQMEDGFITFKVKGDFQLDGLTGTYSDPHELNQIFIGFKNSAEILKQLKVLSAGQDTGFLDNECAREGFAYQTIRPVQAKLKRHDHSLWDYVFEHCPQVCGAYVPIADFKKGGGVATVEFEINLPVTDILCLQAFTMFPNCVLGDLELKLQISHEAIVWVQCSTKAIMEEKEFTGDAFDTDKDAFLALNGKIKHAFTQIGNPSKIVTSYNYDPNGGANPITTWTGFFAAEKSSIVLQTTPAWDNYDSGTDNQATFIGNAAYIIAGIANTKVAAAVDTSAAWYTGLGTNATVTAATTHAGHVDALITIFETNITATYPTGSADKLTATVGNATLTCRSFQAIYIKSSVFSFNVVQSTLLAIQQLFSTPKYIPAQQLYFYAFPHSANEAGFQSSLTVALHNCNCISFMFPRYANEKTVFENIMYQNLQCTLLNGNYPEQSLETHGARFLQYQLVASDLDGPIQPTEEFIASLTRGRNKLDGTRFDNTKDDQTSFMFNVQLERSNAGYCYDGIDTGGVNTTITLKGGPVYTGVNDTYFCVAPKNGVSASTVSDYLHPPNPQMWICSETCWKLCAQRGGLCVQYCPYENPPNVQVSA